MRRPSGAYTNPVKLMCARGGLLVEAALVELPLTLLVEVELSLPVVPERTLLVETAAVSFVDPASVVFEDEASGSEPGWWSSGESAGSSDFGFASAFASVLFVDREAR